MDADQELMLELKGTLTPGYIAREVFQKYVDKDWCANTSRELRKALYASHTGAADRMAQALAA